MYYVDSYIPRKYTADNNPVQKWLNRNKNVEVIISDEKPKAKEDSYSIVTTNNKDVEMVVNRIKKSYLWLGASRYCYENLEAGYDNFTDFNIDLIHTVKSTKKVKPHEICVILSSENRDNIKSLFLKILK